MFINAYIKQGEPLTAFRFKHPNVRHYDDLWTVFDRNSQVTFSNGEIISLFNFNSATYPGLEQVGQITLSELFGGVHRQLEKMAFMGHLVNCGLMRKGGSQAYFPTNSEVQPKQVGGVYINGCVTVDLNRLGSIAYVTIDPNQTITADGDGWNAEFARANHGVLSRNPINYREFIKILDSVFLALGETFKISTEAGEYSYVKAPVLATNAVRNTGYEPKVSFGSGRSHVFPAAGIKQHGPWDYNASEDRPRDIRVGIIGENFSVPLLREVHSGESSGQYPFQGFQRVYKSTLQHDRTNDRLEVTEQELRACADYEAIGNIFREKARQLSPTCDVAVIALPDFVQDINEVNLRDYLKVIFWEEKLASQIILSNTVQRSQSLIVDNLALGIYVAAGGKPWILEEPLENQVCVGISFGISKDKHTLVGIVEIFDGYGLSLSMEVNEVTTIPDREIRKNDMHLSSEQLTEIIRSSITRFSDKYDGNHPERVIVHKTTYFNQSELDSLAALPEFNVELAFVYINSYGNGFNLIKDSKDASPPRLTYWECDNSRALLYTKGPDDRGRSIDPFLPQPLWVEVQAVSDGSEYSIDQACKDIVKLTKLNWNSVVSYEREPATISRSRKIVDLLRAGLSLRNIPTDIRYFL